MPPEKPVCSQEATVRTRHGAIHWFKTGKTTMTKLYTVTPLI